MAGFSGAAVGTGLLSGINNNIEAQRALQYKEQQTQDDAQLQAFTKAQEEDQTSRDKLADTGRKEDAMAKMLASNLQQPIGPWAYATARDAVEMGYTDMEHLPYVLDAAKRTFADQQSNPDKWSVADANPKVLGDTDTNPQQTALLRKMGNQMTPQQLEDIRQHNLTQPHSGLPGANWGDPTAVAAAAGATKKTAEIKATNEANSSNIMDSTGLGAFLPSNGGEAPHNPTTPNQSDDIQGAIMRESGATHPSQLQDLVIKPSEGQMQPQQNPLAIPASSLQPPQAPQQAPQQASPMATAQGQGAGLPTPPPPSALPQQPQGQGNAGIQLNGPPPPEVQVAQQQDSPQSQATAQAPPIQAPPQAPFKGTPQIQPDKGPQLHPERISMLPQATQDTVKGIADGTVKLADALQGLRGNDAVKVRMGLISAVKQYDESWNEQVYAVRQKTQTEYANPDSNINRMALGANKLSNHLSDLDQAVDQTGNIREHPSISQQGLGGAMEDSAIDSLPFGNRVGNYVRSVSAGSQDPNFAPLRNARKNVGEEAAKFFGGGTGSVTSSQEFEQNFPDTMSPEYGHTAVSSMAKSMLDQIIPMQEQQDKLMGPHGKTIADPNTIAKLEKLAGVQPGYRPDSPMQDNGNVPTYFGRPAVAPTPDAPKTQEDVNALAAQKAPITINGVTYKYTGKQ